MGRELPDPVYIFLLIWNGSTRPMLRKRSENTWNCVQSELSHSFSLCREGLSFPSLKSRRFPIGRASSRGKSVYIYSRDDRVVRESLTQFRFFSLASDVCQLWTTISFWGKPAARLFLPPFAKAGKVCHLFSFQPMSLSSFYLLFEQGSTWGWSLINTRTN